jgi:hypothetical protein
MPLADKSFPEQGFVGESVSGVPQEPPETVDES